MIEASLKIAGCWAGCHRHTWQPPCHGVGLRPPPVSYHKRPNGGGGRQGDQNSQQAKSLEWKHEVCVTPVLLTLHMLKLHFLMFQLRWQNVSLFQSLFAVKEVSLEKHDELPRPDASPSALQLQEFHNNMNISLTRAFPWGMRSKVTESLSCLTNSL